jgi:hypothetical protein
MGAAWEGGFMDAVLENLNTAKPRALGELLEFAAEPQTEWASQERRAIFQHQMATPLLAELEDLAPKLARRLLALQERYGRSIDTYDDIIHFAAVPAEILDLVLEFMELNQGNSTSPVPRDICRVLHQACPAKAFIQNGSHLTQSHRQALRAGFLWTREQEWVDADVMELIARGIRALDVLE